MSLVFHLKDIAPEILERRSRSMATLHVYYNLIFGEALARDAVSETLWFIKLITRTVVTMVSITSIRDEPYRSHKVDAHTQT
jgi:hypothetical protein